MDFEAKEARTPTTIGDIRVLLEVKEDESESVGYTVYVLDQNGGDMGPVQGDLAPHLSAAQITGVRTLMASVRTKAQKLIPE